MKEKLKKFFEPEPKLKELDHAQRQERYKKSAKAVLIGSGLMLLLSLSLPAMLYFDASLKESAFLVDIVQKITILMLIMNLSSLGGFFACYSSIESETTYDKIPMFKAIKYSCINAPWNISPIIVTLLVIPSALYLVSGSLLPAHTMLPAATPTEASAMVAMFETTYPLILLITMLSTLSRTPLEAIVLDEIKSPKKIIFGKEYCKHDIKHTIEIVSIMAMLSGSVYLLGSTDLERFYEKTNPTITVKFNDKEETYQVGGLTGVGRALNKKFGDYPSAWLGEPLSISLTTIQLTPEIIQAEPKTVQAVAEAALRGIESVDERLKGELTRTQKNILDGSVSYDVHFENYPNGSGLERELLSHLVANDFASFKSAIQEHKDTVIATIKEYQDSGKVSSAPIAYNLASKMQQAGVIDFEIEGAFKSQPRDKTEVKQEDIDRLLNFHEMLSKGSITVN